MRGPWSAQDAGWNLVLFNLRYLFLHFLAAGASNMEFWLLKNPQPNPFYTNSKGHRLKPKSHLILLFSHFCNNLPQRIFSSPRGLVRQEVSFYLVWSKNEGSSENFGGFFSDLTDLKWSKKFEFSFTYIASKVVYNYREWKRRVKKKHSVHFEFTNWNVLSHWGQGRSGAAPLKGETE